MTRPDEDLANGEGGQADPGDRDLEAPAADAAEQSAPAYPADQPAEVRRGLEVSEWDAVEQSIIVDLEPDDYDR